MEEGLLEEEKCLKDKKKFCLILSIIINIILLFTIIIIIIILKIMEKKKDDKNEDKKSSDISSFSATYNTIKDNQVCSFINKLPHKGLMTCNITKMTIDNNEEVTPNLNYTFPSAGIHTVNFWIDITECDSLDEMFSRLDNLIAISFTENFNTKNIKSMEKMFYDDGLLTSLDLSAFNTENVETFSNFLRGCYNLASINLSNWNTIKARNYTYMFGYCYSLTSIDVSSFNTENAETMELMFYACRSLTVPTRKKILAGPGS